MGKKHKAPSGRRTHWYGGRYGAMMNLYACPVCGYLKTFGEECPRCKKREWMQNRPDAARENRRKPQTKRGETYQTK